MIHLLFWTLVAVVIWGFLFWGIVKLFDGPKLDRQGLIEKGKEERRG